MIESGGAWLTNARAAVVCVGEMVRAGYGMTGEDVCECVRVVAVVVTVVVDSVDVHRSTSGRGLRGVSTSFKKEAEDVHRSTTNTISPFDTQQSFTYSLLPCSHMYEDAIANIVPSGLNDSAATLDGYLRKQTERRKGEDRRRIGEG